MEGASAQAIAATRREIASGQAAAAAAAAAEHTAQTAQWTSLALWQSLITSQMTAMAAATPQFVNGGTAMTVDALLAGFPAAANVGKYARVTDLFGELATTMISESSSSGSYWRPTRTDFTKSIAITANMTLWALKSPPTLRLTGSNLPSRTITLDKTGAWPGARFDLAFDGTLAVLQTLTILGLELGATIGLLTGNRVRMRYDGAEWRQF